MKILKAKYVLAAIALALFIGSGSAIAATVNATARQPIYESEQNAAVIAKAKAKGEALMLMIPMFREAAGIEKATLDDSALASLCFANPLNFTTTQQTREDNGQSFIEVNCALIFENTTIAAIKNLAGINPIIAEPLKTLFANEQTILKQAAKLNDAYTATKIDKGDYAEKIKGLADALSAIDDARQALPILFKMNLSRNETTEALSLLDAAIAKDKNIAELYFFRANGHLLNGALEKAILDYTEAININPKFSSAIFSRANTYATMNLHQSALGDWSEFIKINPKSAIAYFNRGNSYAMMREAKKAIADCDSAIKMNPSFGDAYLGKGMVLYQILNEPKAAIAAFTKAIEIAPDRAAVGLYHRGLVRVNMRQDVEALDDFGKAIEKNP